MPFHFLDHAKVWYDALPDNIRNSWECTNFKARFNGSDGVANEATILPTKMNHVLVILHVSLGQLQIKNTLRQF